MEWLCDGGLTIISFTHNPSNALHADDIIVLNKGMIAQTGTYNDLYEEEEGLFAKLVMAERRNAATIESDSDNSES